MTMQPEEKSGGAGSAVKGAGKGILRVVQAIVLVITRILRGIAWGLEKFAGIGKEDKSDK